MPSRHFQGAPNNLIMSDSFIQSAIYAALDFVYFSISPVFYISFILFFFISLNPCWTLYISTNPIWCHNIVSVYFCFGHIHIITLPIVILSHLSLCLCIYIILAEIVSMSIYFFSFQWKNFFSFPIVQSQLNRKLSTVEIKDSK